MWLPRQSGSRKECQMAEDKPKKARAQHLPKGWEPEGVGPWKCTAKTSDGVCGSEATRFVYQHGHKPEDPEKTGLSAVVTWELPAYVDVKDESKIPHKWKCPVCNYEVSPVLVKCAECGYVGPLNKTQQPREA